VRLVVRWREANVDPNNPRGPDVERVEVVDIRLDDLSVEPDIARREVAGTARPPLDFEETDRFA
jgi:hypothetical protein